MIFLHIYPMHKNISRVETFLRDCQRKNNVITNIANMLITSLRFVRAI